jgi:hypothetical protein
MADSREARSLAREIKFVVEADVGARIRDWSRIHLARDLHGSGAFGDEYRIASLYFDSPGRDVFHGRGSFGRAKYRIRRYGASERVFLERKLRRIALLIKRRTVVRIEDLCRLDTLCQDGPWPGDWFLRRVAARGLGPVCRLAYPRAARTADTPFGPARLTVDEAIRASPIDGVRFDPDGGVPILAGSMVVELKFRNHLPAVFKRLIEEFRIEPQRVSKYRLGLSAVEGLPVPAEESLAPVEPDVHA